MYFIRIHPPKSLVPGFAAVVLLVTSTSVVKAQAATKSPTDTAITSRRANRIADSLLALMTLDEKLGQLTQTPAGGDQTGPSVDAGGIQQVREGKLGSFLGLYGADVV